MKKELSVFDKLLCRRSYESLQATGIEDQYNVLAYTLVITHTTYSILATTTTCFIHHRKSILGKIIHLVIPYKTITHISVQKLHEKGVIIIETGTTIHTFRLPTFERAQELENLLTPKLQETYTTIQFEFFHSNAELLLHTLAQLILSKEGGSLYGGVTQNTVLPLGEEVEIYESLEISSYLSFQTSTNKLKLFSNTQKEIITSLVMFQKNSNKAYSYA